MPLWNPAIEPDVPGQIDALTNKATPVGDDELLIEDSAEGYAKKKILITNLPADGTAIHKATDGEIAAMTDKPNPVHSDLLVIEDSAAGNAKKRISVGHVCPEARLAEITSGTAITTTSTTDVLATGMTLTPEAGTYLVTFSGSYANTSTSSTVYADIWYNGVLVTAASERRYTRGSSGTANHVLPFCCVAKVTANGATAIEGRWRVSSGSTGNMYQRTLSVVKVS